jgi:hypothetical protein
MTAVNDADQRVTISLEAVSAIADIAQAIMDNPLQSLELRTEADWLNDYMYHLLDESSRHFCADAWPRMYRMMLALAERDENAYALVVSELGPCSRCWDELLRLVTGLHTSDSMLRAGGRDKLADVLADEVKELLM